MNKLINMRVHYSHHNLSEVLGKGINLQLTNQRTKLLAQVRKLEERGPLTKSKINEIVLQHLENTEKLNAKYTSAYQHDIWIAQDLVAGTMLTRIVYYELFNPPELKNKLQIKEGKQWLAIKYKEWDDLYIAPTRAKRGLDMLSVNDLIYQGPFGEKWKRGRSVVPHLRLNYEIYLNRLFEYIDKHSDSK